MKVYFLTGEEYPSFFDEHKENIFRAVHFSHSFDNSDSVLGRASIVPIGEKSYEIWVSEDPVKKFVRNNTLVYQSGNLLYARFESDDSAGLEDTAYNLYLRVFELRDSLNANLVRIWNYVPNILDESDNLERYRQFNVGRRKAWDEVGPKNNNNNIVTPSASGIGALGGALKIGVLLSTHKPIHIQNERQTNAYEYSQKYGPKPPTFSRATYVEGVGLFISGTASIVGEDTLHVGNPIEQTQETMNNIETLISLENLSKYNISKEYSLKSITDWRLYIKHIHQAKIIEDKFLDIIDKDDVNHILLHDDICRKDLLVEIEGVIFEQ